MTPIARELLARIRDHQAEVAVLGLGYVGVPLALTFAEAGFRVLGFDIDDRKVAQLNAGESYIEHIGAERIATLVAGERFAATSDPRRLADPDALLICVPTPLDERRQPDMRFVMRSAASIADTLRPGQLVVLESTTYPGTCEELLLPALAASGLTAGEEFFLAYSPEREDPGNPSFGTREIPKLVGGVDPLSGDVAEALYEQAVVEIVRVPHARIAEASKLLENVFRAVNIALVNELKLVLEPMGIDIWEVLDAAETKPFGFMRFDPGPGWGGHCIPIDPFYLAWKARQHGVEPRFIELAGEVNIAMPRHVVAKVREAIDGGPRLDSRRVLLLGLAYKRDVGDPRESPAFEIFRLLHEAGAEVAYHDPYFPRPPEMRTWRHLPPLPSVPLDGDTIASFDAVVVVTDHAGVDYRWVLDHARTVIDTRGVLPADAPNVVRA